uniref:CSON000195 protein n=1 Tax=Culicoides sonorensis TaxID=179676 RepID=A0A336MF18_CULSO
MTENNHQNGVHKNNNKENMKRKARTRVAPFRNREEFVSTFEKIYNEDIESRKQGLQMLQVWRIRRGAETSASILSTAAILEVQLKDECGEIASQSDLQSMYSGAFTRFLNYVTSIEQRHKKRTMYSIANQLGIESFLVDLRHLCSHGKDSPSLDVFRRSANYCMNWLKSYYWERELKFIQNVDVTSIKIHNTIRFERNLKRLLLLYDATSEAIHKNCETIEELYTVVIDVERKDLMRDYIAQLCERNLKKVFNCIVSDLFMATKSRIVKESYFIFSEQLLKCPYFVASTANVTNKSQFPLTKLHQKLFLEMQSNGIISQFFKKCVYVSEDQHEIESNRIAAAYWADKILEGYEIYKKCNSNIRLDRYSTKQELVKVELREYNELVEFHKKNGIDIENILVLKNWTLNPMEINVDENFVDQRIKNLNENSRIFVKRAILMIFDQIEDQKKRDKYKRILDFINFVDNSLEKSYAPSKNKIYTLENDVLPLVSDELKRKLEEKKSIGIFSEAPNEIDWKTIPIGTIFGAADP